MTVLAAEAGAMPAFVPQTAVLLIAAAVIGYVFVRLRIVPIVGFLLAGVVIGPNALALVTEQGVIDAAAEIGVMLLLFTIGIEFSLQRLSRIRRLVLLGGGLQVAGAVALTAALLAAAGVALGPAIFTGFLVALSSTAIVLKLLGDGAEPVRSPVKPHWPSWCSRTWRWWSWCWCCRSSARERGSRTSSCCGRWPRPPR